ncbi:T9SS type A sorting domain-containing protein [Flavobacterium sp. LB3P21]|uniref:T9SS type A sorting domain-containing protein n=1 Tax=Flavobacterium sp. LB3P21 TaxID=3401719 RepID=UPI003AAF11BD
MIDFQINYRRYLVIVGILVQTYVNAQVFVGANTNVLVNNQVFYVKQNLELSVASSNFYLRNQSQLLQGTTGSGANKGLGSLSVFQEGTVNNYQFNYWCSPVGNATSYTAVNNPFGITQLGTPTTKTNTTLATILSSGQVDGTADPFAISPRWINKFATNNTSYSDWVQVGASTSINAGEGFTMKGTSGINTTTVDGVQNNPDGKHQRYDFRGKPNDGTINIPVLLGEWTLTGNPYPSALNLQAFLIGETNCDGTAYFWEQDKTVNSHYIADYKGGYATYSAATNIYTPAIFYSYDGSGNQISPITSPGNMYERKYAPIGQGFMIVGSTNANVQMKNNYRVYVKEGDDNSSQFEKSANDKTTTKIGVTPQIRFNTLLDNGPISQMVLAFDPSSTDGVDRAMDAASPNDGPANNYFVIKDNEYIINIMPFDIDKKIPVGFRNYAQANYKITVNQMLNIPEVTNVYLHDKVTNVYYDIKNSLFDVTLPVGTNNTQYEITFKNGTLGVNDLVNKSSFIVRQDNTIKKLIISNPFQKEIDSFGLYDVMGRLVLLKSQLGTDSSYTFSTSNLSDGIYIVKLITTDKSEMGMKIIVKN